KAAARPNQPSDAGSDAMAATMRVRSPGGATTRKVAARARTTARAVRSAATSSRHAAHDTKCRSTSDTTSGEASPSTYGGTSDSIRRHSLELNPRNLLLDLLDLPAHRPHPPHLP